jgi:hypothetical protein
LAGYTEANSMIVVALPALASIDLFKIGSAFERCRSCGSSLPPYQSDPPPPMTTTLALFFLIMGSVMIVTVAVDPAGALIDPALAQGGKSRDVLSSLSLGSGLLSFGGVLLIFTLKRAGRGAIRWICRRCGGLFRVE